MNEHSPAGPAPDDAGTPSPRPKHDPAARTAKTDRTGNAPGLAGLILPAGVILLSVGMMLVVGGLIVASLFRPGTWVILFALVVIAAGGLFRMAQASGAGADKDGGAARRSPPRAAGG